MKASAVVALVRPFTLLAPVVGVASGVVAAAHATSLSWSAVSLSCGLASALLATAASNAWNQAFDVEIDAINKPSRPIPSGAATKRAALVVGHLCAVAALVTGGFASAGFLACVSAGLLLTWTYSAPPLRIRKRPVGALLSIALARGLLVPVAGWSIVAPVGDPQPWFLGAVVGLYLLGAAATKDFPDVEGDRRHGCRTLPVVLGPRRAVAVIAPFLVLPFLLYPIAAHVGLLPSPTARWWLLSGGLLIVGLAIAFGLRRGSRTRSGSPSRSAWIGMYALLLMAHAGSAWVYATNA